MHCPGGGQDARQREKRDKLGRELELIVAEAKLNQISEEELIQILQELYRR